MKVEFEKDGTLTIKAENGMEGYVLLKWVEDWNARKAVLTIQTDGDDYEQIEPQLKYSDIKRIINRQRS